MTGVVTPIHVAAIGLGNMRFYAPPSGGQEFPWVALEDSFHCFSLPRGMRRQATRDLRREWRGQAKTLATNDGLLTAIPHFMASGMVQAMAECGRCSGDLPLKYVMAVTAAMAKLTAGLKPEQVSEYLGAAMATEESKGQRT